MSYDQSNGQCRCNGKKAIWKYKSTASTDFQATLKKGSPACFGNLMSLERSTCNFIYKSLHIWNQICYHFKSFLLKSFLDHDTNCDKQNPRINDIDERPKVSGYKWRPIYSCSQESPEFGKQFFAPTDFEGCDYAADLITSKLNNSLRENYLDILNKVHSNQYIVVRHSVQRSNGCHK